MTPSLFDVEETPEEAERAARWARMKQAAEVVAFIPTPPPLKRCKNPHCRRSSPGYTYCCLNCQEAHLFHGEAETHTKLCEERESDNGNPTATD